MGKFTVVRVYPSESKWVVKKDGAAKASTVTRTKNEAIEKAKDIASHQRLRLIIHGKDGKIQQNIPPAQSKDDCFITTACVKYYGLEDTCYELQTLRNYRDSYLLKSDQNKALVHEYYSIAPRLVCLLERDLNKEALFEKIYKKITESCQAIESHQLDKAKRIYIQVVTDLISYFKLTKDANQC